jgi:hypothetical protein
VFGLERYRQYIKLLKLPVVVANIGLFGWLAYDTGNPFELVYAVPVLFVFIVGYDYTVRITEEGIVSETYVGSTVPMGSKLAAWDEITGWEVTDRYLRIDTAVGPNFTYDCDRLDDIDRVRAVLDDYVEQG